MNNSIVFQLDPTPDNERNSEGTFVTLQDGRIVYAWAKFGKGHDNDPSIIVSITSTDGGKTWSEEQDILVKPEGEAHNVMSPSLLRLQDNRILFLYMAKTHLPYGAVQCAPMICFSDDEMHTLSSEVPLTSSTDYHVVNNDRVIQLSNGTIVIPVAHHRMDQTNLGESTFAQQFKPAALIFYLLSHDGGKTWAESETSYYRSFPNGGGGFQEPGVIELKEGRLWSWSRNSGYNGGAGRCQWQSFSDDFGNTWSEPEPSVFISPCSPLSMKRIPSTGDLLAVWNDQSQLSEPISERRPLVCAISSDEGATWKHRTILEDSPRHGYCYTAIHFVDDAVLLAYNAGGPRPQGPLQRLRMRRILISELYSSI